MRISDWSSDVCSSDLLVVRAGDSIPSHRVAGSMTLYCIAGHIRLGGDVPVELRAVDWLFLEPVTPHAVEAIVDPSLLLTILFDDGGEGREAPAKRGCPGFWAHRGL